MTEMFAHAALWLALAILATILANRLNVSMALTEICVGMAAGYAFERWFGDAFFGAKSASKIFGLFPFIARFRQERIERWSDAANYAGAEYIGKTGIEASYQRELHGTTGMQEVEITAGGRAARFSFSLVAPMSATSSSLTTLISACPGVSENVRAVRASAATI